MSEETPSLEEQFLDRWIAVQDMVRAGHLAKSDEMEARIARIRNADDTGDLAGGIKEMDAILTGPKAAAAVTEEDRPQLVPKAEPKPDKPLKVDTSAAEKRLDAKFDAFEAELAKLERSLGIGPEDGSTEVPQNFHADSTEIPRAPDSTKPSPAAAPPPNGERGDYQFADPTPVEDVFASPPSQTIDDPFGLPDDQAGETESPSPPATQQPAPGEEEGAQQEPALSPQVQEAHGATTAQQPKAPESVPSPPATQQPAPHSPADVSIPKGAEPAKSAAAPSVPSLAPVAGETWDQQSERFRLMREMVEQGQGGDIPPMAAPAGQQAAKSSGAEQSEQSPWVQEQVKKLHEDAAKKDYSGKSDEELEAITEGRSAAKGADGGVDAQGPGLMDIMTGQAKLDWHTGDYEFSRTTAKPAKGWNEAQKGRSAAPSINGDEGKGGAGSSLGSGGMTGGSVVTPGDVREFKDLLKEIRDLLKDQKKENGQKKDGQSAGFGSALPPKPTLLPNSVPPLKGTGK